MTIRKLRVIFIAAVLFLSSGLLSCQGETPDASMAPDFTLKSLDGGPLKFSDTLGKAVVLDFWATWCPPCRREMPIFQELYEKYKDDGLVIIGVSLDRGGESVVRPFVEKNGITFPIVIGNQGVVDSYGGIRGIPTTFIIDREGKIVHKFVGAQRREKLEAVIKGII